MKYCPNCMVLTQDICPNCGNVKTRLPCEEDPVYLTTKDMFLSGAVEDILNSNAIVFMKRGELGEGLGNRVGFGWERYHFFVAYYAYDKAKELLRQVP